MMLKLKKMILSSRWMRHLRMQLKTLTLKSSMPYPLFSRLRTGRRLSRLKKN
jgi:hypothetical protein